MTAPDPQRDALVERYRDAVRLADEAGPSAALRERILSRAHERQAAALPGSSQPGVAAVRRHGAAANESRWRLQAFGSVMLGGVAALLAWHLYRSPDGGPGTQAVPAKIEAPQVAAGSEPASRREREPGKHGDPVPSTALPIDREQEAHQPRDTAAQRLATAPLAKGVDRKAAAIADASPPAAPPPAAPVAPPSAAPEPPSAQVSAPPPAPLAAPAASAATSASASASAPHTADALAKPAPRARREFAATPNTANAELFAAIERNDISALHAALAAGADPSARDANGHRPLTLAAAAGRSQLVAALLAAGADPHALDREGLSALQHARRRADTDSIELLERAGAR